MTRQKKKRTNKAEVTDTTNDKKRNGIPRNVAFDDKSASNNYHLPPSGKGMRPSPSQGTLNRLERQNFVLWKRPLYTIYYCVLEIFCIVFEFLQSLFRHKLYVLLFSCVSAGLYYVYHLPGPHQLYILVMQKHLLWCLYWIGLGVLSSVGFGTGLHTFLIYLGPHIARVTLAAYECNSLNFPEPPYPLDVTCPTESAVTSATLVSLWAIISKVRVESLCWGAGTALGELPPYFMARTARLSGEEPDDEEYKEFISFVQGDRPKELNWMDRGKLFMERAVSSFGFPGILVFASVPNPFFDLAGITCGHFLVPFWTFFGATLIGKAIVKMHIQMLFVVMAFSEHHVDNLICKLNSIPYIGPYVEGPLKEFFKQQKNTFHRKPGDRVVNQPTSLVQYILSLFISLMIIGFCLSIVNSLAQRYHKRVCDRVKKQA